MGMMAVKDSLNYCTPHLVYDNQPKPLLVAKNIMLLLLLTSVWKEQLDSWGGIKINILEGKH